jgi:hypothetical protein
MLTKKNEIKRMREIMQAMIADICSESSSDDEPESTTARSVASGTVKTNAPRSSAQNVKAKVGFLDQYT